MKSRNLEDWLQIIALFGVIGSLIFVGLQMKQDREIALSEIWQARTAALIEQVASGASNEILLSAFAKSASGRFAEITPIEQEAGRQYMWGSMYLWENSHYQYTPGFVPDEHWMRVRGGIKTTLQDPFQGPLMREISTRMRPSFRAVVEEIDRELTAEKN
jgi:hypothetical protein